MSRVATINEMYIIVSYDMNNYSVIYLHMKFITC